MNLLKSKLRRTTAVVAGSIIGLAGVAFFASPAAAHHSEVQGTATCDTATGEWVVDWTVQTYADGAAKNYRFVRVESTPAGSPVDGIAHTPDDADPVFPHKDGEPLEGTQRVPGDARQATLTVQVKWDNDFTEYDPKTGTVDFQGTCSKEGPKPQASLASTCDGVTVTLSNSKDAKVDAEFTVAGAEGFTKDVTVKAGAEPVKVDVPAKNAAKIVVTEKNSDKPVLEGKWEKPEDCAQPEDNVDRYYEATCDSLIFTVDNTEGTETITATFTSNKGDAKTLVVKAGEKKSATFKGEKGLTVTPSEAGVEYDAIKWDEEKPEDCSAAPTTPATPAAPGAGGGEGDGGSLPVTGAAAGGIAGGAAALLALGAVLFVLARRRKVKFTA